MKGSRYYKAIPAELKFQAVLEMLVGDKTLAELSRSYGVHTNTLLKWKARFLERGAEIFDGSGRRQERELAKKVRNLEQLLGKKEMEIALLKNFLGQEG